MVLGMNSPPGGPNFNEGAGLEPRPIKNVSLRHG